MVVYKIFHYGEEWKGIFSIYAFPFLAQCLNIQQQSDFLFWIQILFFLFHIF